MSDQLLSTQVLLNILGGYARPFDKINELRKSGHLIQVRRGLYVVGALLNGNKPELLLIANHLYGPSYVSADSALAFWGLLPERTYGVSSMCMGSSNSWNTPLGNFSYHTLPPAYYPLGVQHIQLSERQHILIASKEKALCDLIIHTKNLVLRSMDQTWNFLHDDLRIEDDEIHRLNWVLILEWALYAPKRSSLQILAKTLKQHDTGMVK
ncbi:MAG TPA: hypothetical protein DIW47_01660 [Bacteroidetes bacterium]|nr:hypothetical protein [Bacteroidota bacterium]